MRIAIVEILGTLIRELAGTEDLNSVVKQINGLFEHLFERMLDVSSYVRAKVFAVFGRILSELPNKFPRQRLKITTEAVLALEDKTATVRKGAITCLTALILDHPYGLVDGGMLSLEVFQKNYEEVVAELKKAEDAVEKAVNPNAAEGEENNEENEDEHPKRFVKEN
jgi:condensin complex subunit 1